MKNLQTCVGEWAEKTFPKSTPTTIIAHLKDEVKELDVSNTCTNDKQEIMKEAADCFMLLLHLAYKYNFSLIIATEQKLEINKKRKWKTEKNDKGFFPHIKE